MTVLRPRIDWRSLDRAALGEAYNSAAAVANSGTITASWEPRGAAVRRRTDAILDLAYGPRPRNRIDFIKCDPPRAPTLVFVHGGADAGERKLRFRRNWPVGSWNKCRSGRLHARARGIHGRNRCRDSQRT
jgi:hypothetical protein